MTDFQTYLPFLSPENQICEIDSMIRDFSKSDQKGQNTNKKFCMIN